MIFQDDRLIAFSKLFFQPSDPPTLKQEWITAELFDYSIDSLKHIDRYLLAIRDQQASQEEWSRTILRCGAYVGEVIRRSSQAGSYHWLNYEDAVKVNSDVSEFGKSIGTLFVLYHPPKTIYFPLTRIEKFLAQGSENSVFDFAQILVSPAMADLPDDAADIYYQQARQRWVEVLGLSLYDDKKIIVGITPLLESALRINPNHIPSLSLLSELFIMLEAYEEAKGLASKLQALEPANEIHAKKQQLLEHTGTFDERFELKYWIVDELWAAHKW